MEINEIIKENERRKRIIFDNNDQFTGKGIEGHDNKVIIGDFKELRIQYLNDDTVNTPIYKGVIECGTIAKFTDRVNMAIMDKNQEAVNRLLGQKIDIDSITTLLTEDDVFDALVHARISTDPSFAFYVVFNIKYKKGGNGPFLLNFSQRVLLYELEQMRLAGEPIRLILLKARQWGGSTLVQLYMAWIQLFVASGWNSAIIAQTKDTARRIKTMYRNVLDHMPGILFNVDGVMFSPVEGSASDSQITDKKGNVIRRNVITTASYENFESTRGQDYAMVHFSEVAYWRVTPSKNPLDVITNIEGNLLEEPLTIEVAESTARGASGWFHDEYQSAKKGESNRKSVFIPFYFIENDMVFFKSEKEKKKFAKELIDNKDNTEPKDNRHESGQYIFSLWRKGATLEHLLWYIRKRKTFSSHDQMAQEAPSDDIECFTFSGGRIFSPTLIEDRRNSYIMQPRFVGDMLGTIEKPIFVERKIGEMYIWKKPAQTLYDNRYIVIVDVGGRSARADYSVITVIDRMGLNINGGKTEVVARWRGHVRYDELAALACRIGSFYQDAMVVFESNTFDKKKTEASEYVEQGDHIRGILNVIQDQYDNLYMRTATDPEDIRNGILKKVGFQTNRKTKQDMVDRFCVDFESDNWIDPDERFYHEASIYEQRNDGTYGNIIGRDNHDDIIMTDMIGALVSSDMPNPTVRKFVKINLGTHGGTANESNF